MKINGFDSLVYGPSENMVVSWENTKKQKGFSLKVIPYDSKMDSISIFDLYEETGRQWVEISKLRDVKVNQRYLFILIKYFLDGTEAKEELQWQLNKKNWQGKWIGHPQGATTIQQAQPAPIFRKLFTISRELREAHLFISGLGFYEFRVNNLKTEDTYLNPPFTHYDKTTLYDCWDITDFLSQGSNKLDILLGNGWYNAFADDAWDFNKAAWKSQPKVIFDLELIYEDGTIEVVASDQHLLAATSAILFDGLRNGEVVDGTNPAINWPNIEDDLFPDRPKVVNPPGGRVIFNQMEPIRCGQSLKPVNIKKIWNNHFLVDFGQNIAGWSQLNLNNIPEGTEITLTYGEKISPEGILDQRDISKFTFSGNFQKDTYITSGQQNETWHPYFVYHGFQYVEIIGLEEVLEETVTASFIHTDLKKLTTLSTNEPVLQWIQDSAIQSTLSNYHGIPTDCPQREKNGWTGDVALSASQMLRNFDSAQALKKWLKDIIDAQRPSGELPGIVPTSGWGYEFSSGPAWDSVILELPYQIYRHKGQKQVLVEMLPYMELYMGFLINHAEHWIIDYGLGDWCAPNNSGKEHEYYCPTAITGTAIFYHCCQLMLKILKIIEQPGRIDYFKISKKIKKAFREKFMDFQSLKIESDSQTAYAVALYYGLIEESERTSVLKHLVRKIKLVDNHLECGIIGTKALLPVLFENGYEQLAFEMLTKVDYPSWGYWRSLGATTMWEHWRGFHSRNHHMFSCVSDYLQGYLGGIKPLKAGYQEIEISPSIIQELTQFSVTQITPQGEITVRITGGKDKLIEIILAENISGVFKVPSNYYMADFEEKDIILKRGINRYRLLPVPAK